MKNTYVLDSVFDDNVKNGWTGSKFKITPRNGGFALEELKAMMSGKPEYREVYFSRNRADVESALRRRS